MIRSQASIRHPDSDWVVKSAFPVDKVSFIQVFASKVIIGFRNPRQVFQFNEILPTGVTENRVSEIRFFPATQKNVS